MWGQPYHGKPARWLVECERCTLAKRARQNAKNALKRAGGTVVPPRHLQILQLVELQILQLVEAHAGKGVAGYVGASGVSLSLCQLSAV